MGFVVIVVLWLDCLAFGGCLFSFNYVKHPMMHLNFSGSFGA